MGDSKALERTLPGLKFTVKSAEQKAATNGKRKGLITLRCDIEDKSLWDAAVAKLDGYVIFSSTTEEILNAFSNELNTTDAQLQMALAREQELLEVIQQKEEDIASLRQILSDIGVDLGIEE